MLEQIESTVEETPGPIWPPGRVYELVVGAGDHSDCMRCVLYALPNCGKMYGGCGVQGFWRVKEVG